MRMKLTREGKRFMLATVLLTFAAYNTGNNLIYLILALMLSIIAIAAVSLAINLSRLSLMVSVKGPVFAGQSAAVDIYASNGKRIMPAYSLRVIMPTGMRGECRVARVRASGTSKSECRVSFESRGVYKWGDFGIESSFPFIFISMKIRVPVTGSVMVYPRLVETKSFLSRPGEGRGAYSIRPGRGEDLLMLREFRAGDDARQISWKASARGQGLMVREFSEEIPGAFNIILDDLQPFDPEAFERAVSYAASLAVRLMDEGFYVGLVTSAKVLPYGIGPEQLYRILDVLAVAKEIESPLRAVDEDNVGTNVLILKSVGSPLRGVESDMVIYASEL